LEAIHGTCHKDRAILFGDRVRQSHKVRSKRVEEWSWGNEAYTISVCYAAAVECIPSFFHFNSGRAAHATIWNQKGRVDHEEWSCGLGQSPSRITPAFAYPLFNWRS
jgi:hypothetical protein